MHIQTKNVMDDSLQHLIATVQSQDFPHKEEFLKAVASGRCVVRSSPGVADSAGAGASKLLGIYSRRRDHLARKHSAHARALTGDVAWLCKRLEVTPPGRVAFWIVYIGHPYNLDFFLNAETNTVLGCMKTVSQLDVTPEEWDHLWLDE